MSNIVPPLVALRCERNASKMSGRERVIDSLESIWGFRVVNHAEHVDQFERALLVQPQPGVLNASSRHSNIRQLLHPHHVELESLFTSCGCNFALTSHYDCFVVLLEAGTHINPVLFRLATGCQLLWQDEFNFNSWCQQSCYDIKRDDFIRAGLLRTAGAGIAK